MYTMYQRAALDFIREHGPLFQFDTEHMAVVPIRKEEIIGDAPLAMALSVSDLRFMDYINGRNDRYNLTRKPAIVTDEAAVA